MPPATPFTQPNLTAQGNIRPCRWIVSHASIFQGAIEATGKTALLLGISEAWTRFPPNSPGDDGYIAIAGEALSYRGPGQVALLQICAGTAVTDPTILITSDTDGTGIPFAPVAGTVACYGAVALRAGAVNEKIPVFILSPFVTT